MWDVVLSDYNLPSFGPRPLSKIGHAIDPDLPLVVGAGTVGEEFAVKMLHAVASAYVRKDSGYTVLQASGGTRR